MRCGRQRPANADANYHADPTYSAFPMSAPGNFTGVSVRLNYGGDLSGPPTFGPLSLDFSNRFRLALTGTAAPGDTVETVVSEESSAYRLPRRDSQR